MNTIIRLTKVSDDRYNGNHPNGINEGYECVGTPIGPLEVGTRFGVTGPKRFLVTSEVIKIIDENTFKTRNSTYKIEDIEPDNK